jgi:hypothetical protein
MLVQTLIPAQSRGKDCRDTSTQSQEVKIAAI